jgi:hypothetical protein
MKKYAKKIALGVSTIASGVLLYHAIPILRDSSLSQFHWMIWAIIGVVFIAYYQLLADILKEML